ncbi:hypothetical protein CORC01_03095 [Colletotrichum orchidophilum]|uniref:Bacteriocin-protection protein n=1 Tax=Colletotrichum orchidophilum TaxID=1209926 RepID=A0A1G4BJT3_9PEZI|nr:uncharacterized protein CORC01_03095 [Colletotrichum orchidophilum]OHF01605.1 hypothetical protein CORC01_03095 [Colletotrichum orchidophilum]
MASLKAETNMEAGNLPETPGTITLPPRSPESIPTLLFEDKFKWENYLESSYRSPLGVWLKISKKNAEKSTVTYDQALDVALCFGWIDGQRKAFDEQHFIQRFTPRRKNSLWSKRNVDKVAALTQAERMRPAGQAEVNAAKADGRWDRAYSSASMMEMPLDFAEALRGNEKANEFFDSLNKTQRYAFLWRIETTKRSETRKRKIDQYVGLLAEHKTI